MVETITGYGGNIRIKRDIIYGYR